VGVVWDKQFWWSPYAWMKRCHPDSSRSDRREPLKRECLGGEQGHPAHGTTRGQKVQKGSKYANLTPVHLFGPVPSRVGTGLGLGVVASTDPVLEPCLWLSGSNDSKSWTGDRREVITGCVPVVTPSCESSRNNYNSNRNSFVSYPNPIAAYWIKSDSRVAPFNRRICSFSRNGNILHP
jgi:hypothetical protein